MGGEDSTREQMGSSQGGGQLPVFQLGPESCFLTVGAGRAEFVKNRCLWTGGSKLIVVVTSAV